MQPKLYSYVGPQAILDRVSSALGGRAIRSANDVRNWIKESHQDVSSCSVIVTFVVDEGGTLLVADRRSEHVACSSGRRVQSAGEMTFTISGGLEVESVSNQSVGYCPEPESWPAVAAAISSAGMSCPDSFSPRCEFRQCRKCDNINLIKNEEYTCAICGARLPVEYNVQP